MAAVHMLMSKIVVMIGLLSRMYARMHAIIAGLLHACCKHMRCCIASGHWYARFT